MSIVWHTLINLFYLLKIKWLLFNNLFSFKCNNKSRHVLDSGSDFKQIYYTKNSAIKIQALKFSPLPCFFISNHFRAVAMSVNLAFSGRYRCDLTLSDVNLQGLVNIFPYFLYSFLCSDSVMVHCISTRNYVTFVTRKSEKRNRWPNIPEPKIFII